MRTDSGNERGAAAVEFALVSTLLVALLVGIVDFGYAFFVQGTLSGAAREAARSYAIHGNESTARAAAKNAAGPLALTDGQILIPAGACPVTTTGPDPSVTVTITYANAGLTGFFGSIPLTATGTMRCNG